MVARNNNVWRSGPSLARHATAVGLAGLLACAATVRVQAQQAADWPEMTLTYASSLPEASALNAGLRWWASEIEKRTGGAVTVDTFYAGSLLGAAELLPGAADGRVDMAYVSGVINPDRWPLWHLQGVPFQTDDPAGQMWAWYELYQSNEAYRAEWENNNVHNLMQLALAPAVMGLSEPVDSVAGFENKRVRMVGLGAAALQELGMETVAISPVELYTSIQRGVVDGYGAFPFDLVHTQKLQEVAPATYEIGIGHYAAASIAVNRDMWNGLDPALRELMTEVAEEYMTEHALATVLQAEAEACEQLLAGGAQITVLADSVDEEIGDASVGLWREQAIAAGHEGAEVDAFFDAYMSAYTARTEASDYENGAQRCASQQD